MSSDIGSRTASVSGELQRQVPITWLSFHFCWKMTFNPSLKIRRLTINIYAWNQLKIYGRCLWINRNLLYHFSFDLYWSGLNFKTNVKVVLFKREHLIKTIWWLSVTYIAWGNHLGSLSYRQLVSMSCGMQLFHLALHPPWSDRPFAKHRNSLSFGTHRWCSLTSTINDT
jgi:hypothetical protein